MLACVDWTAITVMVFFVFILVQIAILVRATR